MSDKYPGGLVTAAAPAGYSVFFNGSSAVTATGSSVSLGTGSFTIEFWLYYSGSVAGDLVDQWVNNGVQVWTSSSKINLGAYNTSNLLVGNTTLVAGTWYHVAISKDATLGRIYINGVLDNSASSVGWNFSGAANFSVGSAISIQYLTGYMSNVRVTVGSALYTSNFTPPTAFASNSGARVLLAASPSLVDISTNAYTLTPTGAPVVSTFTPFPSSYYFYNAPTDGNTRSMVPSNIAGFNPAYGAAAPGVWTLDQAQYFTANRLWPVYDPYYNYTTLMLNGNSPTNVPTWITDASTNNFAVTVFGDARAAGLSPFSLTTYPNSGSGYFDGNGDYLTVPDNVALELGAGDFTIEGWVNFTTLPSSNGHQATIFSKWAASPNQSYEFYLYNNAGTYQVYFTYSTNGTNIANLGVNWTPVVNTWYHVACVRSGSNLYFFVNGSQQGATQSISGTIFDGNGTAQIGSFNAAANSYLNGYISNLRVVKGVAVYTGAFTTPTAPLGATQSAGTNIAAITGTSTSLLTLQNSQSSNNNSFLDSSSNNFLITRNGNTTQGTFSPFSPTGWSNYFNGSSDFFNLSSGNASFALGTGAFTIEAWVYVTKSAAFQGIFSTLPVGATAVGFGLYINSSDKLACSVGNGSTATDIATSASITFNTWVHVAATRAATTGAITVYINGVSSATGTASTSITSQDAIVGRLYTNSAINYLQGYISNVRVSNVVRTISVPTVPYSSDANTLFLVSQSNRFVDNGANSLALNIGGTPSVQAFSPFAPTVAYSAATVGGSGYFDGTSDYINTPTSAAILGTNNWTFECWVYLNAKPAFGQVLGMRQSSTTNGFVPVIIAINTTGFAFYSSDNGSSWNINNDTAFGGTAVINQWYHVAVVRDGSTITGYVNGVATTLKTGVTSNYTSTSGIYVGGSTTGDTVNCYVSNARVVNGTAVYTGAFTPPIAPVLTAGSSAPYSSTTNVNTTFSSSNTAVLLNFTNAGITDATVKNVLETVGNAQISTVQSRFGGSSMYFDGTGDYLISPDSQNFNFGSGDFTIEAWINTTVISGEKHIIGKRTSTLAFSPIIVGVNEVASTNRLFIIGSLNGSSWGIPATSGSITIPTTGFTHIAVVRSGTTIYGFVNGVLDITISSISGSLMTNTTPLSVAASTTAGDNAWNGYIDDFRISKYARYTANFVPPTSALQQQ